MSTDLTGPPDAARRGWASRVWRTLSGPGPAVSGSVRPPVGPDHHLPERSSAEIQGMTRRLIAEDRYVFVLLKEAADDIGESEAKPGWKAIAEQMALVPGGTVPVVQSDGSHVAVEVPAFYLDRCAVTNRQFQRYLST